ncbi:MAG: hypothetical protein IPO07_27270 [Haliscomenobacter sp.]|nr:hypothetical protein [Haliscomenobacter sp.]MBK9492089.1 hypothetical protein [Haliscomenobacter sp.]
MQFQPGDLYSRKDHNTTLSWLINLGNFKFVKNRFQPIVDSGELRLNAYYYLTPLPKKIGAGRIDWNFKTNNLTGSQITLGWRHRNTFRGQNNYLSISSAVRKCRSAAILDDRIRIGSAPRAR